MSRVARNYGKYARNVHRENEYSDCVESGEGSGRGRGGVVDRPTTTMVTDVTLKWTRFNDE